MILFSLPCEKNTFLKLFSNGVVMWPLVAILDFKIFLKKATIIFIISRLYKKKKKNPLTAPKNTKIHPKLARSTPKFV
jgi:hypothetical protein